MKVFIFNENISFPSVITKTEIKSIVKTISENESVHFDTINFILSDDEYILKINQEYLQHDFYTDIITFEYNNDKNISSDIFISVDTVRNNARLFKVSYRQEILRIVIHGLLHLCGFDDKDSHKKIIMTERENFYLEKCNVI